MSVSINLIRSLDSNSKTDDRVTIFPEGDKIRVSYMDRQNGSSSKQALLLGKGDLGRYVQNLGLLFLNDLEPFKHAQFNFPGFPSFLVDQRSLKNTDTQDALMEIADLVATSWFTDDLPPRVPVSNTLPRYNVDFGNNSYSGHY